MPTLMSEQWQCMASDAEVLAVAAGLDLTWPYPLPGLPADAQVAAALVDSAMAELELVRGEAPASERSRELAFAIVSIIEARPRAALYLLDTDGEVLGWTGLYYGREQWHGFERVHARGVHEFTIGSDSTARDAFMAALDAALEPELPTGSRIHSALLIDNEREDRVRLFDPNSRSFRFVHEASAIDATTEIPWTEAESLSLAAELLNVPLATPEREGD